MKSTLQRIIDTNKEILGELSRYDSSVDVVYTNGKYHVYKNKKTIELSEYLKGVPFESRHRIQSLSKHSELISSVKIGKNKYKSAIRVGTDYISSIIVDKYGIKSSGIVVTDTMDEADSFLDKHFPEIPEHMFTKKSIKEVVSCATLSKLVTKYEVSPHMVRGEICLFNKSNMNEPDDVDPSIQYMSGSIDEFELIQKLCTPYLQASILIEEFELLGLIL